MGLIGRLRRSAGAPAATLPGVSTKLRVVRDEGAFEADDGSTIHSLGLTLIGPDDQLTQVGGDGWLRQIGCRLCKVAGLTHHADAAQDDRFAPGSVVVLARDPDNPVDPSAVGVWDRTGEVQVGFVPAADAPEIAERIAAGEPLGAAILREYRTEPVGGGRRLGLVMLVAPHGTVTLSVEARPAERDGVRPAERPDGDSAERAEPHRADGSETQPAEPSEPE